jgi:dUTP pyrophosphatase
MNILPIKNLEKDASNKKTELNEAYQILYDAASTLTGNSEELEVIMNLLSLPDETFNILAPVFLDELERGINNSNEKLMMVAAMNQKGVKVEDLIETNKIICEKLDSPDFAGVYGKNKTDFMKTFMGIIITALTETEGVAKRFISIPIELCGADIKIPTYAHVGDAGLDVYAIEDVAIAPGETVLIKTGLKMAIPYGYEMQVRPRSGMSLKTKLRVCNTPGTIDSGYRDEIGIIMENVEPPIKDIQYNFDEKGRPVIESIEHGKTYYIHSGDRIAQLVLNETPKATFVEVESVQKIEGNRGGGYGSTGK